MVVGVTLILDTAIYHFTGGYIVFVTDFLFFVMKLDFEFRVDNLFLTTLMAQGGRL